MDAQLLLASLIKNKIWLKILGVFFIAYGVFACITIIGLLIGWLPIWLGLLLISSGKQLDSLKEKDNTENAVESIERISLFFKISGIVALGSFSFVVIMLILVLAFVPVDYECDDPEVLDTLQGILSDRLQVADEEDVRSAFESNYLRWSGVYIVSRDPETRVASCRIMIEGYDTISRYVILRPDESDSEGIVRDIYFIEYEIHPTSDGGFNVWAKIQHRH